MTTTWSEFKQHKWYESGGNSTSGTDFIVHVRYWNDLDTQVVNTFFGKTTISESVLIEQIMYYDDSDTEAITETYSKDFSSDRTDWVEVTEVLSKEPHMPFSDSVGITELTDILRTLVKNAQDSVGATEDISFDISWHFDETFSITEPVAFDVSWVKSDSVGITEEVIVRFQMVEDHSSTIAISDELDMLVWDTSESGGMSLVDDVRDAVQTTLSLSDAEVAALSINDLLHAYWSANFPLAHTYDGSESTFTPAEDYSTMDHHSSVESQEGTDLNWIRSVTAT